MGGKRKGDGLVCEGGEGGANSSGGCFQGSLMHFRQQIFLYCQALLQGKYVCEFPIPGSSKHCLHEEAWIVHLEDNHFSDGDRGCV